MNIIFFGSDNFAAAHLKKLIGSSHDVTACVTQPDKPKGRGMKMAMSPIKEIAQDYDIPIFQPENVNDQMFVDELKSFDSDVFVVIAYGRILPQTILDVPNKYAINVHASLLPKYRGAAPINFAIINGERLTGLSIIRMNAKMDAGDILKQIEVPIDARDTALSLREKMLKDGPSLLLQVLKSIEDDDYKLTAQDERKVSFTSKLTKELGHIDWQKNAVNIHNLIRGLIPWPNAFTTFKGKQLKILATEVVRGDVREHTPGEITKIDKNGFTVAAGKDYLYIKQVHLQNAKPMDAASFVNGQRLEVGFQFRT